MKKYCLFLLLFVVLVSVGKAQTLAKSVKEADTKVVKLLNEFVKALLIEDFEASVQALLPIVHNSLTNDAGDNLTRDLRDFSFKKAHNNAQFYASPVVVTRVRKTDTRTAIGYGDKAEKGRIEDYFIGKKQGVNGMPAPVQIFFPADGSEPKIAYMGSL